MLCVRSNFIGRMIYAETSYQFVAYLIVMLYSHCVVFDWIVVDASHVTPLDHDGENSDDMKDVDRIPL